MNKKKISVLSIISFLLMITLVSTILSILGILLFKDNVANFNSRTDNRFAIIDDYTCTEIVREDSPTGTAKEYRFVLPVSHEFDTHIAFYLVHQFVEVTIDGKSVASIKPSGEIPFGYSVGSNWLMLPLFEEDAEKEICITVIPAYKSFENRVPEILVGSELGIYLNCLISDSPQIFLSVIAIFFGILFLLIAAYSYLKRNGSGTLASLGWFSVMLGIWRLSDSLFTPFMLASKPVFLFYTSVFMMMLSIIFIMRSISKRLNYLSRKIFDVTVVVSMCIFLIQIILDLSNIIPLRETLFVTHLAIIINAIISIVNLILNLFNFNKDDLHITLIPLFCVVGPIIDVILFYVNGTSSGLVFSLGGFVLYVVFSGIFMLYDYTKKQQLLKEKEKQLIENQISIMLSQIQPHFLFNSLGAIRELCKQNPEEAREALDDFSDYLRTNMDSLGKKHLVHFSEELAHVKTYLKLEKLRFGDDLNINYEINETDFFLPPLSLQPLVENAVKHGICSMPQGGGKLTVRTKRDGDKIILSVIDNGVGFDAESLTDNSSNRSHIGIENVRSRLKQLLDAELIIESSADSGTHAQIIFEKRNHDDNTGS